MRYRVYLDDDTEGVPMPIRVQDTEGDNESFHMTIAEAAGLAGALETVVNIAAADSEED